MRTALGIIVGYLIFAFSAVVLFQISGIDPHGIATIGFKVLCIVYGIAFAFLGGYVACLIAQKSSAVIGVAVVLAVGAAVSIVSMYGKGTIWSPVAALLTMAPAAVGGGTAWSSRKHSSRPLSRG